MSGTLAVERQASPVAVRTAVATIRGAIERRDQVIAHYHGQAIAFCPHALAGSPTRHYALAFLILGGGVVGDDFASPQRWRWLPVDELTDPYCRSGGVWFSAPPETRPTLPTGAAEVHLAG